MSETICKKCRFYRDQLDEFIYVCTSDAAPITNYTFGIKQAPKINFEGKCPYYKDQTPPPDLPKSENITVHDLGNVNRDLGNIADKIFKHWSNGRGDEKIYIDVMGGGAIVYERLKSLGVRVVAVRRKGI